MNNDEGQAPAAQGPLSGFAVYSSDDLETGTDAAPAAADAEEEAAPEAGERYIDPEDIAVAHNIRMRPGSSLSIGHRNVYRTDRRGVPHFTPGWTPGHARAHYRRTLTAAAAIVAACFAASAAMSITGIGSDSEYTALASKGALVEGTVSSVHRTTEAAPGGKGQYTTEEKTVFSWQKDGAHTGTVSTSTTDVLPPLARETVWEEGQKADLYVDPEDPSAFVPVNPDEPGRVNAATLIPVCPAVLAAGAAVVARKKMRVMQDLEKAS